MNRDATPSWSGYIFQGEVALCRAIEEINRLGSNILDEYCLKLEEDEDFSIKTDELEVFQVKAYLGKDSEKISSYKDVIQELIDTYYYSKTKVGKIGKKDNYIYSLYKKDEPIKSCLITEKIISNYPDNLSTFNNRYNSIDFTFFNTIQGEYTLNNITDRLNKVIKLLLNNYQIQYNQNDIDLKRDYCCYNINKLIKKRHQTKVREVIYFNTIVDWVLKSDLAFNEEIAWYKIRKIFFNALAEGIEKYDLADSLDSEKYNKIINGITELNKLTDNEFKSLVQNYLTPHKEKLSKSKDIKSDSMKYIDDGIIQNIIKRAIREINKNPDFKRLQYNINKNGDNLIYQLTTHSNQYDIKDRADDYKFQQQCELISKGTISEEVDYFVTNTLNVGKEEVQKRLINVTYPPQDYEQDMSETSFVKDKSFGFKSINESIDDLNK